MSDIANNNGNGAEWKKLCEAVLQESDPQRMLALVEQLNLALEHKYKEDASGQALAAPNSGASASAMTQQDAGSVLRESDIRSTTT